MHPISLKLYGTVQDIKCVVKPLYERYNDIINEWFAVPFKYEHLETSDETIEELEKEIDSSDSDIAAGGAKFEQYCDDTREQVTKAIDKTSDEIKKLEKIEGGSRMPSKEEVMIDEMDDLFDDDDDSYSGKPAAKYSHPDRAATSQRRVSVNRDIINDIYAFEETFRTQLCVIENDLFECIHTLKELFLIAYDGLKEYDDETLIVNSISDMVFEELYSYLILLYR